MRRLAFAALLVLATPVWAQDPNYDTSKPASKAPMAPSVSFSDAPIWQRVPGTTVSALGPEQRKAYDLFGLYNQFYMYAHGYWYKAELVNGPWKAIEPEDVPQDFHLVPKSYWVHYPKGWDETRALMNAGADTVWTPPARFESVPNWRLVPNSDRVYWVQGEKKPAYDLFRSTSKYYTYQNGAWYVAGSVNGPYRMLDSSKVPDSFKSVNEKFWVSYPADWKTKK